MAVATFQGDVFINGTLVCANITIPANSIANAQVQSAAAIASDKVLSRPRKTYAQASGAASVAATQTIHVVSGLTGTLKTFQIGSIVANVSGATITADLKKNGTTVLAAVVSLDDTNAAYELEVGSITNTGVVQDDVLTIIIAVAAGGGTIGQGVFAELMLEEDPQ